MPKRIVFTSGTLQKLTDDVYTLVLFNGGARVYSASVLRADAADIISKHYPKIKMN